MPGGKGVPKSPEHRARIAAALRGKAKSDAAKAAMSAAKRGKPGRKLTEAEKAALNKTGTTHSLEAKEKMRQAKLANPVRYWLGKKRGPMPEKWRGHS